MKKSKPTRLKKITNKKNTFSYVFEKNTVEKNDDFGSSRHHQDLSFLLMKPGLFDLSAYHRAKKAIDFSFDLRDKNFHVIVIGENRSGRVSSTYSYLKQHAAKLKKPADWVYLNNFSMHYRPIPFALPNGLGKQLKEQLHLLIQNINIFINQLLNSPSYLSVIEKLAAQVQFEIDRSYKNLVHEAEEKGFVLEQTEQGIQIHPTEENKDFNVEDFATLREKLGQVTLSINLMQQELKIKIDEFRKKNLHHALEPLFKKFRKKFELHLGDWIPSLEEDVINNIEFFFNEEELGTPSQRQELFERYAVNLLVDNTHVKHPKVILINNPSYEGVFGSIQYLSNNQTGLIETNFTMIKPGALHLANGGFLVIRADNLIRDPELWENLKAALRDKRIRIYEKHREGTLPVLDAPRPHSIPLDIQVFLVASPSMYYTLLQYDPDFLSYFKIKAEIDSDMPKSLSNIKAYHNLLKQYAKQQHHHLLSITALNELTDYASRLTGSSEKLSSQFEIILDILDQALVLEKNKKRITIQSIHKTQQLIQHRHGRFEEELHEQFASHNIIIDTKGQKVGQINGLTVLSIGDNDVGCPSRITAQTYVGKEGVINIERLTEMAGPIQQKGTFIIDAFLKGIFAQDFPLSCGCSITFEQAYSDIDGDSASLAELIAILSSLSEIPIKQNIAITGSLDQFGFVQSVGGVTQKIEGFYKLCADRGLTKEQGVIIPQTNLKNMTLNPSILKAIDQKRFHIYHIKHIFDALYILFEHQEKQAYSSPESFFKDCVYQAVYKKLEKYANVLQKNK